MLKRDKESTMQDKEEAPLSARQVSVRIAIEGESPNEGGDVTLEISARRGNMIGIVAKQGDIEEEESLELLLSRDGFQRFLTLAQSLLSVAGSDVPAAQGDVAHEIVAEHLALEIQSITERTSRYMQDLTGFLCNPHAGIKWLRIDTLRMVAQWLGEDYERVDGLLRILERQGKDAVDDHD
jgi:hypothetical protein